MDAQREPTGHRDWRHLLGPAVESLRDGVALHDLTAACRASNPSARAILGVTREQLESQVLEVRAKHADGTPMAKEDQPLLVTLRTGEAQQDVRIGFERPDGAFVLLSLTCVPLIEDGEMYGAIVTFEDVTACVAAQDVLARAEREASESARRLRTIVDHLPDAMVVVVDPDLRIVTAGGPGLKDNGYSGDEVTGLLLADILPADRVASLEPRFQAALAGREQSFEWRAVRTDADMLMDLVPLAGENGEITGVLVVLRDVTERARADRQRFEVESVFRATFEGAPIGLCMIGTQGEQRGCFMRVNPAMAEMLGVPAAELAGRPTAEYTHPDDLGFTLRHLETVDRPDNTRSFEKRYVHRDGHTVWALVTSAPVLDVDGTVAYRIAHILDITGRKLVEGQLQHLADHDALTGLYNRRRFGEELGRTLAESQRHGVEGSLMVLDLDGFKSVNDRFGHAAGDELIARIGGVLKSNVRATDVVARLGGDEFAVILRHTSASEVGTVAEKLLAAVRNNNRVEPGVAGVTTSIGVALFGAGDVPSAEKLLVGADLAMYAAKQAGCDGFTVAAAPGRDAAATSGV